MTPAESYFYQALYVSCSLAKPFLKLSRAGNKNTRRERKRDRLRLALLSLHVLAAPVSDLLSAPPPSLRQWFFWRLRRPLVLHVVSLSIHGFARARKDKFLLLKWGFGGGGL